ncbi:uncharacterized protein LOC114352418 [Ostrinia furnacalis]|uniref:uncharacterized protein LOC114352418 n=1 Tax=Ostrinia furnacalis TaxID=93504 RepID=UPI00103FB39D|nr:uncharacterized protein LOC114352418 [Ostrinia furnacalis]
MTQRHPAPHAAAPLRTEHIKGVDAKIKRLQKYKSQWEIEHGDWLINDPLNEYNGKCKLCGITFTVASAGIGQIKQHQQTKQHKSKVEMRRTTGLIDKFLDSSSASTSSRYSDKENIVASELALTYHTVKHNLSYNSMDCTIKLNKMIYVDSSTATAIRLARTKMEALVTEVLGPYSLQNVIDAINTDNLFYCLQTDASNKKNIKLR